MITASALARHCAYAKVLGASRTPTPEQQEAIGRGVEFHAAIEQWIVQGELPTLTNLEVMGWVDLLAAQWRPPEGARAEVAWGLTPEGDHVYVTESEPHVYVSAGGVPLLTAGRADVAWIVHAAGLLVVVDWKAGKWPVTPAASNLQANAAGRALARRWGASSYVPAIYYARDGFFDWGERVTLGSPEDRAMLGEIRAAATLPLTPIPGEWCSSCWERRSCAAAPSGQTATRGGRAMKRESGYFNRGARRSGGDRRVVIPVGAPLDVAGQPVIGPLCAMGMHEGCGGNCCCACHRPPVSGQTTKREG